MKAFVVSDSAAGSIRAVEVVRPRIGPGELLVQICAVGVGIHDSYFLPPNAGPLFPIGIEGAGIVAEVGAGVAGYRVGERIAFVSAMQPKGGTWAEYAVVDAQSLILPMPAKLDFVRAAALPVAGNTVFRAFSALGELPDGAALFIAGGAGAIGTLAIQLARQRGWRVRASTSPYNHDFIRSLGAELTVDVAVGKIGWITGHGCLTGPVEPPIILAEDSYGARANQNVKLRKIDILGSVVVSRGPHNHKEDVPVTFQLRTLACVQQVFGKQRVQGPSVGELSNVLRSWRGEKTQCHPVWGTFGKVKRFCY